MFQSGTILVWFQVFCTCWIGTCFQCRRLLQLLVEAAYKPGRPVLWSLTLFIQLLPPTLLQMARTTKLIFSTRNLWSLYTCWITWWSIDQHNFWSPCAHVCIWASCLSGTGQYCTSGYHSWALGSGHCAGYTESMATLRPRCIFSLNMLTIDAHTSHRKWYFLVEHWHHFFSETLHIYVVLAKMVKDHFSG